MIHDPEKETHVMSYMIHDLFLRIRQMQRDMLWTAPRGFVHRPTGGWYSLQATASSFLWGLATLAVRDPQPLSTVEHSQPF